ncbi:hypothetical protein M427DRAFT_137069 [Gonapodya prolifera JEL478]|uniref:Endonuclease/exonuclease/phosphatase domain-containing protein n=1 Tax=Gonapodya prolifera (strain JEL478) TaxID=1344416 RepID=A0A139A7G7_GONPJ|nr:hypothetical protein M427DRAFT_137069 [Gonapodya prolifera JEL478]|eukprot:KXS12747.1 hypothetical protein M427DRAFT_137069 [Gonapodya prolifera JEL478]
MSPQLWMSETARTGIFDLDSVPEFIPTPATIPSPPSDAARESKAKLSYASVASVPSDKKSDVKKVKSSKTKTSSSSTSTPIRMVRPVTVNVASTSPANLPAPLDFPPILSRDSKSLVPAVDDKALSRSAKRRRRRARKAKGVEVVGKGDTGAGAGLAIDHSHGVEDDDGIADDESEHPRSERGGGAEEHELELPAADVTALLNALSVPFSGITITPPNSEPSIVFPQAVGTDIGSPLLPIPSLGASRTGPESPATPIVDDFEFEIEPYFADDSPSKGRYQLGNDTGSSQLPTTGSIASLRTASSSVLESNTDSDAVASPGRRRNSNVNELKPPLLAPFGHLAQQMPRGNSFSRVTASSDSSAPSSPIDIFSSSRHPLGGHSPRSHLFGPLNPHAQYAPLSTSQGSYHPRNSHGHSPYLTDESGGEETLGGWSVPTGSFRASPHSRSLNLHPGAAAAATHYGGRRRSSFATSELAVDGETSAGIGPTPFDLAGLDIPPNLPVDMFSRSSFWPGSSGQIVLPIRRWRNGGLVGGDNRNFSVGSYNVLCPLYATTLKFSATDEKYLDWDWRKWRILEEIAVYGPDILCLQEVSPAEFNGFFFPQLQALGYDGIFQPKKKQHAMDGCATFYKQSKFQLLVVQAFRYHDISIAEQGGASEKRDTFVRDLALRFNPFDNVALIAVFRNKYTNARLRVANTHFHWDPAYQDTKLLQACVLMDWLSFYHPEHPLIICGDLNSLPTDPVVDLMLKGTVPTSCFGDRDFGKFTQGREAVTHSCRLDEAYKTQGDEKDLPFTNATPDFRGHIDHILYTSTDLLLRDVLRGVDSDYLESVGGLPTALFPSDHLFLLGWFRERREPTYRRATNSPRLGPASALSPRLTGQVSSSPRVPSPMLGSPRMTMSPRTGSMRGGSFLGSSPPAFGLDGGLGAMRWDPASGGRSWNR